MVNLVDLAYLLRATTKNGHQLCDEEVDPRENPGYEYRQVHVKFLNASIFSCASEHHHTYRVGQKTYDRICYRPILLSGITRRSGRLVVR